jgi:hypothetical protein
MVVFVVAQGAGGGCSAARVGCVQSRFGLMFLVLFCGGVGGVVLLDAVVFAVVGGSWFCLFAVVWY